MTSVKTSSPASVARDGCGFAVHYWPAAFDASGARAFGRQSANANFLAALAKYGGHDVIGCCARSPAHFQQFQQFITACRPAVTSEWLPYEKLGGLAAFGTLYHPDVAIAELAWQRRPLGAAAVSLCGVSHGLCTRSALDAIGALLTAPVEEWDALVCTSRAAKEVVEQILSAYGGYLVERFRAPFGDRFSCL